jgi:hypothetical protein
MWERHEELKPLVSSGWNSTMGDPTVLDVSGKLRSLSHELGRWGVETFGSVRKEIKKLRSELDLLRSDPVRVGPTHREIKINDRLVELYHREEIMWRQRSRADWLAAGDKNSHYFHQRASIRRRKNLIKSLTRRDGVVIEEADELKLM